MAKSPETVLGFLEDLKAKALAVAQSEYKELSAFAKELDGVKTLQKWDSAYYSEKLKKKRFDIDDALLKPFFKLENVLEGAFAIAKKLFQIQFRRFDFPNSTQKNSNCYTQLIKKIQQNFKGTRGKISKST